MSPIAASRRTSATRPLGSTKCSTSHASPPSATDAANDGRNACGKNPCPTRLRNTAPSANVPTRYAALCPSPSAATFAVSLSNVRPPTTITAAPTTALDPAMIAGVRLSPSAYDARAKKRNVPYVNSPTPSDASTAANRSASPRLLPTASTRMAGSASATYAALTGSNRRDMLSRPQRSRPANDAMSPLLTSRVSSGRIVVWIGWARIA